MANGLLAAFGGMAKYGLAQEERKNEEASDERKARLRMKLEQELWQARTEYSKLNPEYNKYVQNPVTGDVEGFDQFGRSKILREGTEAERGLLKENRDLSRRKDEANIKQSNALAESTLENAASNKAYRATMAAAAKLRADTGANKPPSSDRIEPTENQLQATAINSLKATRPDLFLGGEAPIPGDPEYDEFLSEVSKEMELMRQARGARTISAPSQAASAASQAAPKAGNPYSDILDSPD